MPEYLVEEFIGDTSVECTLEEQVDKKVSLLYDMCMLYKRRRGVDNRERAVRELLASYQNETQMDNAVHDIIVGNCTLDELLKRKGYMCGCPFPIMECEHFAKMYNEREGNVKC